MRYFILVILMLFGTSIYAQIDKSENGSGKRIGRESHDMGSPHRIDRGFSSNKDKNLNLFGNPKRLTIDEKEKNDKVDITKKSDFIEKTIDYTPSYLSKKEEGKIKGAHAKPQDLGKYYTSSDAVKISWRDSQVVDGDRVDIIVNDTVVVHNVTLLAKYHSIYVDLKGGFTKIEFKALNQGQSGPNTADFKVETEKGTVLTHGQWNLLTGVKAHLTVVKN